MLLKLPSWAIKLLSVLLLVALAIMLTPWLLRDSVPNFSSFAAGKERKQAFVEYLLPLIEARNAELADKRQQLLYWQDETADDALGWWDSRQLNRLAEEYGLPYFDPAEGSQWQELLRRVDQIPPSMVIVQAANESAWGTSRFAREGNNYFGQWCYVEGCGMVPTQRGSGEKHEVKAFDSPAESLQGYFLNINTHLAYKEFRLLRSQQRKTEQRVSGISLLPGLEKYSERGVAYINDLRGMIRHNNFDRFDQQLK